MSLRSAETKHGSSDAPAPEENQTGNVDECTWTAIFKSLELQFCAEKFGVFSDLLTHTQTRIHTHAHTQGSTGAARSYLADIPCSGQLLSMSCLGNSSTVDEHPLFSQIPKTHNSLIYS